MLRRAALPSTLMTVAVLLLGCGEGATRPADSASSREAELRILLGRISQECGLPAGTLGLMDAETIQLQPSSDASLRSVECALTRLRENRLTQGMSMGFVGNGLPEE